MNKVIDFNDKKTKKKSTAKSNRFVFLEALGLTEIKLARSFMELEKNQGRWLWNKTRKNFMFWSDPKNIWVEDTDSRLYNAVAEYTQSISEEYSYMEFEDSEWGKIERFIVKSQTNAGIESIIRCCRAVVKIIDETELDKNAYLINLKNGVYDLKTQQFHPSESGYNKGFFLTKQFNVKYVEGKTCPTWEKTVADIFLNDKEYIDYIQRVFAYAMLGEDKEHSVFILHGENGRNGKTTLLNILAKIMGDYFKQVPARAFTHQGKDQELILAELYGKRLALVSETERGAELAVTLLKSISGGNTVSGRRLYQSTIEYKPTYKVFIETNHLPAIYDDNATWERMHTIKFERYFEPHERDKDLPDKLEKELEGIFLWLLEGWRKYQERKLIKPQKAIMDTQEHRNEFDTMGIFLNECFVFTENEDDYILPQEFYEIYKEWATINKLSVMNGIMFGKEIKKRKELIYKPSKRIEIDGKSTSRKAYVKIKYVSPRKRG